MQRFEIDDTSFPLLIVRAPESFDDDSFGQLFRHFESTFQRRERYALLLDTSRSTEVPSARQRAIISAWQKEQMPRTKRWNVGTALVVTSALVRGALTALSWVVTDETPRVHVATEREAIAWCCDRLVASEVPLTARIERLRNR